jgi:hypothetical protein
MRYSEIIEEMFRGINDLHLIIRETPGILFNCGNNSITYAPCSILRQCWKLTLKRFERILKSSDRL